MENDDGQFGQISYGDGFGDGVPSAAAGLAESGLLLVTSQVDETGFQLRMVTGAPSIGEVSTSPALPRSRAKSRVVAQVRFCPSRFSETMVLTAPV